MHKFHEEKDQHSTVFMNKKSACNKVHEEIYFHEEYNQWTTLRREKWRRDQFHEGNKYAVS